MPRTELIDSIMKELMNRTKNLSAQNILVTQAENDKRDAANKLENAIGATILENCSNEFFNALDRMELYPLHESTIAGGYSDSYLKYLKRVIFYALSEENPPLGFEQFIAPGMEFSSSYNFCTNFRKDFEKIEKLFGLELEHVESVKIGYAYKFIKRKD